MYLMVAEESYGSLEQSGSLFFTHSNWLRMPCTLTTWAVVQALMNINVAVEAELMLAFWA